MRDGCFVGLELMVCDLVVLEVLLGSLHICANCLISVCGFLVVL